MRIEKKIAFHDSVLDYPIDLDSANKDNELITISAILGKDGHLKVIEVMDDEDMMKVKEAILDKDKKVETYVVRTKNALELEDLLYNKFDPQKRYSKEEMKKYNERINYLVQRAKEKGVEREFH